MTTASSPPALHVNYRKLGLQDHIVSAITQGDNSSLVLDTGSARDDLTSVVTTHLRASVDKDYAISLASIIRRLGRTSRVVDTPDVLAMLYYLKGVCCFEEGFPACAQDDFRNAERHLKQYTSETGISEQAATRNAYLRDVIPSFIEVARTAPRCIRRNDSCGLNEVAMALGHADASFSENQNNIGSEHKGLSSASLERANLQPSVGQKTPKRSGGTRCEKHTRLKQRCVGSACEHFGYGREGRPR